MSTFSVCSASGCVFYTQESNCHQQCSQHWGTAPSAPCLAHVCRHACPRGRGQASASGLGSPMSRRYGGDYLPVGQRGERDDLRTAMLPLTTLLAILSASRAYAISTGQQTVHAAGPSRLHRCSPHLCFCTSLSTLGAHLVYTAGKPVYIVEPEPM